MFSVGKPGECWGLARNITTKFGKWLSHPFCLKCPFAEDKSFEVVIHGSTVVMFKSNLNFISGKKRL